MRHAIHGWLFQGAVSVVLGLLSAGSATAGEMVVVQDGQPRATIVVAKEAADGAKQKIQTAADELQAYVQKISGAKLPIVDDAQSVKGPVILVGRSRLSDALGVAVPAGLSPDRRDEGFVIVCRGDRLLLAGNNDTPSTIFFAAWACDGSCRASSARSSPGRRRSACRSSRCIRNLIS
jgi:hypothetical protein